MIRSREEREKSEISGRDLRKPFWEFKTVNSILLTKYCSHRTEISTKDIVTSGMPHHKIEGLIVCTIHSK